MNGNILVIPHNYVTDDDREMKLKVQQELVQGP